MVKPMGIWQLRIKEAKRIEGKEERRIYGEREAENNSELCKKLKSWVDNFSTFKINFLALRS